MYGWVYDIEFGLIDVFDVVICWFVLFVVYFDVIVIFVECVVVY